MKFEAINIMNEKVIGTGIAMSDESIEGWSGTKNVEENVKKYGESLSFLFENSIEWVDSWEFNVDKFEMVYTNSIKVIEN